MYKKGHQHVKFQVNLTCKLDKGGEKEQCNKLARFFL